MKNFILTSLLILSFFTQSVAVEIFPTGPWLNAKREIKLDVDKYNTTFADVQEMVANVLGVHPDRVILINGGKSYSTGEPNTKVDTSQKFSFGVKPERKGINTKRALDQI